jgi:hypothetical protein
VAAVIVVRAALELVLDDGTTVRLALVPETAAGGQVPVDIQHPGGPRNYVTPPPGDPASYYSLDERGVRRG